MTTLTRSLELHKSIASAYDEAGSRREISRRSGSGEPVAASRTASGQPPASRTEPINSSSWCSAWFQGKPAELAVIAQEDDLALPWGHVQRRLHGLGRSAGLDDVRKGDPRQAGGGPAQIGLRSW